MAPGLRTPDRSGRQVGPGLPIERDPPAPRLVPPMSTPRTASWFSNIERGARCTTPIRPASSGWRRIADTSTGIFFARRIAALLSMARSPHSARAKPAPNHDPLGAAPLLEGEKASDDADKLAREVLDRAFHDRTGLSVPAFQGRLEFLLVDQPRRLLLAKRVISGRVQASAAFFDQAGECDLVGASPRESRRPPSVRHCSCLCRR